MSFALLTREIGGINLRKRAPEHVGLIYRMQTIASVDTKKGCIAAHDIQAALECGLELYRNSSSGVDSCGSAALENNRKPAIR